MHSVEEAQLVSAHADEIRMNGYTILEERLPAAMIEEIRTAFDIRLDEKRASEPPNRGASRFQMHLPFHPPFANARLYDHPLVTAILENLFGKDMILTYFASDTPLPGSDYQKVHLDTRLPFPEAAFGVPVYSVVLNVPLVDYTEDNGPLEFWPGGTHLIGQPHDLERLSARMPSARPLLQAGSILLRDARMWHRGTPNRGTGSRPNLALVYSRGWFRFENHAYRIKVPRAAYTDFDDRLKALFRYCAILEPDGHISDTEM